MAKKQSKAKKRSKAWRETMKVRDDKARARRRRSRSRRAALLKLSKAAIDPQVDPVLTPVKRLLRTETEKA
jgi:hypothetical protein